MSVMKPIQTDLPLFHLLFCTHCWHPDRSSFRSALYFTLIICELFAVFPPDIHGVHQALFLNRAVCFVLLLSIDIQLGLKDQSLLYHSLKECSCQMARTAIIFNWIYRINCLQFNWIIIGYIINNTAHSWSEKWQEITWSCL